MFHTLMALWVTIVAPVQTSDTTIRVEEGMRLNLRNEAGEIRVTTWERHEVRVVLSGARGVRIDVERSGSVLRIRSALDLGFRDEFRTRGRRGRFDDDEVDFALTVPVYLDLELYGVETDISVVGMNASVTGSSWCIQWKRRYAWSVCGVGCGPVRPTVTCGLAMWWAR